MARLGDFNPDAVVDDGPNSFDPIPPGVYVAHVMASDLLPTKTGSGQRLTLTFEIIEGHFSRRRIWESLNILNSNAQAQEIAQRDLKRLCEAVGHHGVLNDSEALHFKPFRLRVGIDKDNSERNVAKGYSALGAGPARGSSPERGASQAESAQQQFAQTANQQTQQRAAGGGSRPWAR